MADIELGVVLKADGTAFVRDVRKAKGEVGGLGKEGQAAGQKMNALGNQSQGASGKVKQLGRSGIDAAKGLLLVGGAVATIVAAATGVVKTTGELDTALAGVAAVSGATTEQMSALEAQARDLGATTQFSAAEAAGAQEFLAKAGFTVDQTMQSVEGTMRLAAAGTLDLGRAADISSNILSAFGLEARELDNVVDIMAATASRANTDVEQLGLAMQYTAPIAKAMGVSIEETSAAIGVLSNAGLQGEKAGTGLRNIFIKLANPSDRLRELMGDLSLEADGLAPIMQRLATSGLGAGEAMDIFGAEAGPAFNVMSAGASDLRDMAEGLRDVDGVAESIANKRMDTLAGDWKEFNSAFSELQITIGRGGLQEGLRTIVQGMTEGTRTAGHFVKALTEVGDQTDETGADVERFGSTNIDVSDRIISALGILVDVYRTSFSTIGAGFQALGRTLGAGGAQIVALFQGRFSDILEIGDAWKEDMGVIFEDLGNLDTRAFRDKLEEIRTAAQMREPVRQMEALADALSSAIPGLGGSAGAIGALGDAAGDAAGNLDGAGGAIDDTGDAAGDAEPKLRSLAAALGEVAEAQLAAGRQALQDIDKRIEGVIDATRTEHEQIEITRQRRIDAIEDAVRVERISAEEAADLKRRVDEDYWRDREQLERGNLIDLGKLQEEIQLEALRGVQDGFTDFYRTMLDDGKITFDSLWGSFEDLAKQAISNILGAITTNLFVGLLNDVTGGALSGLGVGGGGGGGNILGTGAAAIGKKLFGGASTSTGAGQAVASGAQTFALGPTTGTIAPTAVLGAGGGTVGGISGATVTGGTTGAGLGGPGAAGFAAAPGQGVAGLGAGTLALPVAFALGSKFVMEEVFGMGGGFTKLVNAATEDLQRAGPAAAGGLGLQASAGDKFGFAAGANSGFAAEFAKERGIVTAELADGLQAFRDVDMPGMIALLDDAQAAYEQMKTAGVQAFRETGVAAEQIGVMLQDGVINQAERAVLGIEGIGVAYEHPKTGVIELQEITEKHFGEIVDAINDGELRLEALQGQARLTGSELDVLGRIGVTAAQSLSSSAAIAAGDIGRITSAAREAASAVGSIPSGPSARSFGGTAPRPSGSPPGLAEGGIASGPLSGYPMTLHGTEAVIPLSRNRTVPVEMRGGPATGADPETKALLRGILAELGNLRVHATIDDRSRAALANSISEPLARAQRQASRQAESKRRERK